MGRCFSSCEDGRVVVGMSSHHSCRRDSRLTASRYAEHPCGGAALAAKASIAPEPNTRLAGAVEDPRHGRGCFALYALQRARPWRTVECEGVQGATPFGAPEGVRARREAEAAPS